MHPGVSSIISRQIRVFLEMRKYFSTCFPTLNIHEVLSSSVQSVPLEIPLERALGNIHELSLSLHSRTLCVSTISTSGDSPRTFIGKYPYVYFQSSHVSLKRSFDCIEGLATKSFFFSLENTLSPVSHSVLAFLPSP